MGEKSKLEEELGPRYENSFKEPEYAQSLEDPYRRSYLMAGFLLGLGDEFTTAGLIILTAVAVRKNYLS